MQEKTTKIAILNDAERAFKHDYPDGHRVEPPRRIPAEERKIYEEARYAKHNERLVTN